MWHASVLLPEVFSYLNEEVWVGPFHTKHVEEHVVRDVVGRVKLVGLAVPKNHMNQIFRLNASVLNRKTNNEKHATFRVCYTHVKNQASWITC